MVGINLNGVVQGRELSLITKEIFNRAKSQNSSAKTDEFSKKSNENPFQDLSSSIGEFVPQETKTAKTGFEQNILQIDSNIQQTVNTRAAIDRYSLFASKDSGKSGEGFTEKVSEGGLEINSATKDRGGKNPFAFLYNLPQSQKETLNEDQLRSIFEVMANTNKD